MPRNGSGGFNLVTNTWSPATNGVSATAADWTALINDLAAAVQQSISADGQTPVTGSLNMGGNRLTGLSAGNATGHSLRFEQLFSQGLQQDIAAAATVDIGAGLSVLVNVTGTGAITSFGTNYNGPRYLRFAGVCTLTNSATLVLPGGANITTAAGDSAIVVPLGNPATGWRVAGYDRASGLPAMSGANTDITSLGIIASINGGQLAGMRNRIINGKMDISQRGTSFPAIASSAYSLDRWVFANSGASNTVVGTMSQSSENVNNSEFQSTLRYTVTTADASLDSLHLTQLSQRIEGYNVRDLIGKTFTLSFWVRSAKTGVHSVAFSNSNNDRSYVLNYTVNAVDAWEYKTVTVSGGLITAGTWDWTTGSGLQIRWTLACGSSFQTASPGTWISGDARASTLQVNVCDTIGNIFAITGVQLEVGSVATPFEHRPIGMELALCQRYYEVQTTLLVNTANNFGGVWAVTKRATPTIALTIASGSGATASAQGVTGWYQNVANSAVVAGNSITATSEL